MASERTPGEAVALAPASRIVLRPHALAGRRAEVSVAAAAIAALALVFAGDIATPVDVAVSALGLIPLLAAMWLLGTRLALVVAAVAIGQLLLSGALGTLSPVTVAADTTAYLVLAFVCRAYAANLTRLLATDKLRLRVATGNGLTRREEQVARLAAQGYTAREIGLQLHIGRRTVETHLANACGKLGVRSKRELTRSPSLAATAASGELQA